MPGHNVVLRTHPAESPRRWEKLLAGSRVHLIKRSNPHPWLLGAELAVHAGSTTGLEAAFMDRPVVNLAPTKRPDFEPIVNSVNPTFVRWQDAAAAMEQFLGSRSGPIVADTAKSEPLLAKFFPGYREGTSAKTIAAAIAGLLARHGAVPREKFTLPMRSPYVPMERHQTLKDKMTVSQDEFVASLKPMLTLAGYEGNIRLQMLDDSLFLLVPA
jgi:hypothetical protein